VYYKRGELSNARVAMHKALCTGSKDAALRAHQALIFENDRS
jgi:hypothetical protein